MEGRADGWVMSACEGVAAERWAPEWGAMQDAYEEALKSARNYIAEHA